MSPVERGARLHTGRLQRNGHPIISRHWVGVDPFRPIGDVAAVMVADLKRQREVEYLHRLGPRAIGEMLREVANGEDLDRAIEAYQRLTPDLLKAVGGDRFPPLPIHRGAVMTAEVLTKALGGCWHGTYGIACCPRLTKTRTQA